MSASSPPPRRVLMIVLDSVGIGHAPDAEDYGDAGANTLGHIRETVSDLSLPNLDRCGLAHAEALAAGLPYYPSIPPIWNWGALTEQSAGKDTTTGHWELAGAPLEEAFATFDRFPPSLLAELEQASGVTFLGNYAQSGTVILDELGDEHLRSRQPILYTSADSVLQIAAHERIFTLEELYTICKNCRVIADRERIARVIARPFAGEPGSFQRSPHRRDFSMKPPRTILDSLAESGCETIGIGKISDIFAGAGINRSYPTKSNQDGMEMIEKLWTDRSSQRPQYLFANLVDFDTLFGHRRNPVGYARALEDFDRWLGDFLLPEIDRHDSTQDLILITADHGNDPTWPGSDHTREKVPLLVSNMPREGYPLESGIEESFEFVAGLLAQHFN